MDFRLRLLELINETQAFKPGSYTLSSGGKGKYYFDGRLLTLHPEALYRICDWLLHEFAELQVAAVGGPTLGADSVIGGVTALSYSYNQPMTGFIVRKEPKEYGERRMIEGPSPGTRVAIFDDTATTGTSLLHAISQAESLGCEVVGVYTIADWKEFGGFTKIVEQGYNFQTLFILDSQKGISLS